MGDRKIVPSMMTMFKCPQCEFKSDEIKSVQLHINIVHTQKDSSSTDENELSCPFPGCGFQCDEPKHLQDHVDKKHPEAMDQYIPSGQIKKEKNDCFSFDQNTNSVIVLDSGDESSEKLDFVNRQLREQPKSNIFNYNEVTASINDDFNLANRIQNMNRIERGSESNEMGGKSTTEGNYLCPFGMCYIQFNSGIELQKHIQIEHGEDPNDLPETELLKRNFQYMNKHSKDTNIQHVKNTQNEMNVKKMEIKSSSIYEDNSISDESSEVILIQMPNESVKTVPSLDTQVQFNGAIVTFSFLLLHAECETAKKNLYELYSQKTTCKAGRPMAIEWLERRIPNAVHWNSSTLNDRFMKAEQRAKKFVGTKAMANKTGMGSLESIKNKNYLPAGVKVAQSPSNEMEQQMASMVKELQEMRDNIKAYNPQEMSKKIKLTNNDENDGQTQKHVKANAFMKSLKTKQSTILLKPNLKAPKESDYDLDSPLSAEEPAFVKLSSGLKRTKEDKVQEADTLRRSSVHDTYEKRFQTAGDDDLALKNMSTGFDNLGSLATRLLEQEINGVPNNQQIQLMDSKLKAVEESQGKVELEMKNSSQRLNVIEQNQEGQSKRFDAIEKNQNLQSEQLSAILSLLQKQDKQKEDSKKDQKNDSESDNKKD